ncbi:endonuclease MutS2 [Salimicrobium flavidum]|uniref:Endonuclease MutS2 n=1 Tax=Salimicrobium flavidum TaxID=570947 RepID=A0A1N7JPQ4_9BACI|nr:endonuclease MutS2 [Salimicrobium flavidum]SIS51226.1 DNA mismatch repair protein MutS2 [Salimicrobium flavidum]
MNERILGVLEYGKIIENLTSFAETSLGKEAAHKLKPSSNLEEVKKLQEETDEAQQILRLKGHIPLGGITNIKPHLKRTSIGGVLSASECLDVATTIYGGKELKRYIEAMEEPELPIIRDMIDTIHPLPLLERHIKNCIDDNGVVMDGASDALRSIRSKINTLESRLRDKMESYTKQQSEKLSDAIVTIRNERYVLPVKQEYRGSIKGIVHDQSSSGATLFIEPQAVVDINNDLQEARVQEKREIDRILAELSEAIEEDRPILSENVKVLAGVDFIFSRAKLGRSMKAAMPLMNKEGRIVMKQARHPLLSDEEVVPNDVELGTDFTSIIITGPNTGGKTVTLKLVGLCTLMAQSGLQVPAMDGCEMAVFDNVYADIGDEQSIEQSLSTFSSHMTNIVDILEKVDDSSLVLFDELGAGTDPQEGAALAMSILDEVVEKNARVIATTHYPELKAYGYNKENVTNASVEFDIETLQPTYRLLIGVPGRSNAFEISRRLGLREHVISAAKERVGVDSESVESMIASLDEARREAEADYEKAEDVRQEAEQVYKELREQWKQFEDRKEKLYQRAEDKAKQSVEKARQEAQDIVDELKKMKSSAELKDHEWIEAKKMLDEAEPELVEKKPERKQTDETRDLQVNDEVKVLTFNQQGVVVEKISEKEYLVQVGSMKIKAKRKDLEFIKAPKPKQEKPLSTVKGRSSHVKPELDLRGERYDEALHQLEKYLDDALLAGYPQVSIIHGKGTGALRQGVQALAKRHSKINAARAGGMKEGGSGVTILELK